LLIAVMIDFNCGKTKLGLETLPLKEVTATLLTMPVLTERIGLATDAGQYKNDAPKESAGQF